LAGLLREKIAILIEISYPLLVFLIIIGAQF